MCPRARCFAVGRGLPSRIIATRPIGRGNAVTAEGMSTRPIGRGNAVTAEGMSTRSVQPRATPLRFDCSSSVVHTLILSS